MSHCFMACLPNAPPQNTHLSCIRPSRRALLHCCRLELEHLQGRLRGLQQQLVAARDQEEDAGQVGRRAFKQRLAGGIHTHPPGGWGGVGWDAQSGGAMQRDSITGVWVGRWRWWGEADARWHVPHPCLFLPAFSYPASTAVSPSAAGPGRRRGRGGSGSGRRRRCSRRRRRGGGAAGSAPRHARRAGPRGCGAAAGGHAAGPGRGRGAAGAGRGGRGAGAEGGAGGRGGGRAPHSGWFVLGLGRGGDRCVCVWGGGAWRPRLNAVIGGQDRGTAGARGPVPMGATAVGCGAHRVCGGGGG